MSLYTSQLGPRCCNPDFTPVIYWLFSLGFVGFGVTSGLRGVRGGSRVDVGHSR